MIASRLQSFYLSHLFVLFCSTLDFNISRDTGSCLNGFPSDFSHGSIVNILFDFFSKNNRTSLKTILRVSPESPLQSHLYEYCMGSPSQGKNYHR